MRILCDQNVADKYINAFEEADWITVTTVRGVLSTDATDEEIVTYAENNDWVVFTSDDDFFQHDRSFGLLVYSQIEDPLPSDVVDVFRVIRESYADTHEILETVPDEWL